MAVWKHLLRRCPSLALACLVLAGLAVPAGAAAGGLRSPAASGTDASAWIDLAAVPDAGAKLDLDGRFLVYLEAAESLGSEELWSVARSGGAARLLSGPMASGSRIGEFLISPDGRWVAFTASSDGGPLHLYRVEIGGGAARRVDADRPVGTGDVVRFAFRPDSRALAFALESVAEARAQPERVWRQVEVDELFADGFNGGNSANWSDTTPNACPTPTGGPTLHANSVSNETWTANGSPHILTNNTLVPAGITLTVAPCAEVRVHAGSDLTVQGTLIARGTPLQRITFKRDDLALPWDSIWVRSPGFADLAFLDLSGGGAAGASVLAEGIDTLPAVTPLLANHLKVVGSTSYGVRLFRRAAFAAGSRDLVVSGAGATDANAPFPVRMALNTVGTLPVGTYTGNASDQIQVIGEGSSAVEVDDVFHNRGVPYQIGGPGGAFGLIVVDGDPTLATLTIDAGVELRFYTSGSNIGGLFVGISGSPTATGRIVAVGTASAPILFTGAGGAPVAGSWEGLTFFGALASGNLLDHVQIDAAGDNGGDAGFGCPPPAFPETSGALKLFSQPSSQFLTNSTISRSSTHGIFRAWIGSEVDFLAGNTFDEVPFCNQVLPKPPSTVCPVNPACS